MCIRDRGELTFSMSEGIASSVNRAIDVDGTPFNMIQVTAAINPGNSGGALFNMQGQVIGINSSKIASTEYEGMGFAVPSSTAVDTANSLIKNGYVAGRAKIGVTYNTITSYNNADAILSALTEKGFKNAKGTMVISQVSSDSDLAGKQVKQYDMIVAVNGKTMTSTDVMTQVLSDSKPGDTIKMMATGAEFTLVEVGHMGATSLTPCSQLQAGEVGYLTASIKTVQDTRVGDTVTLANNPTPEALPGYRQVKPMVFCGIYPADGAKYPDLKDALEKLQLNDASLTFELETSAALGFGFRCGFLGLLHMEIITERLEREFDLDIITTTPSVRYRLTLTDGTVEMIDNPSSYPDPSNIVKQEEPFVDVHLYTPNEYVGALMDLCQQKRGVLADMKYLDDVRVDLHYALPLGEIVYDFFDAIKSRSRGYASYDYEFKEYRESDLVKLDFLLNGDPVDALSMIVFRDNAYAKGRRICEKLRDNIPRTLFEIPVQAAIGGKIIARETVKAMRKDVLAKCYGGDISRKKKLLEKQKEGKKKMRQLGSVELPSEAFTAVLKLDSDDD